MHTDTKGVLIDIGYEPEEAAKAANKALNDRLNKQRHLIEVILVVVAIGFIAMIISVFTIFIEHQDFISQKNEWYWKQSEIQSSKPEFF